MAAVFPRQVYEDIPIENRRHKLLSEPGRPIGADLLGGGLGLLLLVAMILPIAVVIGGGFVYEGKFSLYWLSHALQNPIHIGQLFNSLALAVTTTICCMLVAIPLAVIRTRFHFRGAGILGVLLLVPLILPPFVGALSMRRILAQGGVLNRILLDIGILGPRFQDWPDWLGSGFPAVVVLQVLHLFPILYLNVSAALANVDPSATMAARNLGAGPLRAFRYVTLPLIRPGLFAGGTIVFIWALTDIGTPLIVGFDEVLPVTLFQRLAQSDVSPLSYSLVFVLLSTALAAYVIGKFVFGRSATANATKASVAEEARRLGKLGTLGAWLMFGTVIAAALTPHVGVVLTALSKRWVNTVLPSVWTTEYLRFVITRPATYRSILNSLAYAGSSTVVDILLGCTAAWLMVRAKIRGRTILDSLCMLPLAVPGIILAAGYVALTVNGSWLEAIGPRKNPFFILVIAYSVRRLPFMVRGVSAGLQQVPPALEEAGRNLGATRTTTIFRITLPLITANIIAAGVLTFAFAMLEVSDSLILAQSDSYYPITKEIYRQMASGNVDAAAIACSLGVYGMLLLGGTFAVAGALMGRRLGAIFRA